MTQIILTERTIHLASYTFFTRDVDQYKNTSLSQLYQPPKTSFSQNTYHYPANISTSVQRCFWVDVTSRRCTTSNQR